MTLKKPSPPTTPAVKETEPVENKKDWYALSEERGDSAVDVSESKSIPKETPDVTKETSSKSSLSKEKAPPKGGKKPSRNRRKTEKPTGTEKLLPATNSRDQGIQVDVTSSMTKNDAEKKIKPVKSSEKSAALTKKREMEPPISKNNEGSVVWYHGRRGFGFIAHHETGDEFFVHRSAIAMKNPKKYWPCLAKGEPVEFDLAQGHKGVEAVNVTGPGKTCVIGSYYANTPVMGYYPLMLEMDYRGERSRGKHGGERTQNDDVTARFRGGGRSKMGVGKEGVGRRRGRGKRTQEKDSSETKVAVSQN